MGTALWLGALTSGCRSFDPDQFDARLREATFDAYVETIETQFGGLAAAGVTAAELADRYREPALLATTPESFYGELRAMLADLNDPHAALHVSPRFWSGPVAEPEWVQFVVYEGVVWMGIPEASLRTPREMSRQIEEWLDSLGVDSAEQLDPEGVADFLRAGAAYGSGRGKGMGSTIKPLVWVELERVDGRVVETPHDAELLIRGALGSVARLDVVFEDPAAPNTRATVAVLRNAGVFETEKATGGVRRRLNPLELADKLDPDGGRFHRRSGVRSPMAAGRALRRMRGRSAFRLGHRLELPGPEAEAFGLEAWQLRTPAGERAAFLRVGSFRNAKGDDLALQGPLARAIEAFRGIDHWIIDVTQNPGGSWHEAGLFVSYFLGPEDKIVPHEVTSIKAGGNLLFRTRTTEVHRLARVNVEPITPVTVYVLVDQDTASAGEIVASTLRGKAGAILVGERTAGAEYSTAEFEAPDGSVLRIGLSGGMMEPYESFQGRGLRPDIVLEPEFEPGVPIDLEVWRIVFRYKALRAALVDIDETMSKRR